MILWSIKSPALIPVNCCSDAGSLLTHPLALHGITHSGKLIGQICGYVQQMPPPINPQSSFLLHPAKTQASSAVSKCSVFSLVRATCLTSFMPMTEICISQLHGSSLSQLRSPQSRATAPAQQVTCSSSQRASPKREESHEAIQSLASILMKRFKSLGSLLTKRFL